MIKAEKKLCPQCNEVKSIQQHRTVCCGCRHFNERIRLGEIREPQYADITTEGYKEPMQKVDDGFGYYGAVTRTNDGEHIQCHECGYFFANLSAHVLGKHKINHKDYKMKYGLRINEGLLSPMYRKEAQKRYNMGARTRLQNLKKAWEATAKKRADGWVPGGDMWTDQTRNEKGMCRAQTIAKIVRLAELNGGVVTFTEFVQEYGQGQSSVIAHWFGTWVNALKEANVQSYHQVRRATREDFKQHVLQMMKDFYEEFGRTPQTSDFNGENPLPDQRKVTGLFGSLNNARRLAEIPELIKVNNKWIEVS